MQKSTFTSLSRYLYFFSFILAIELLMVTDVIAQSDGLPRGAYQMPYTRYEAEDGSTGGGALAYDNPTFDEDLTAAEASNQQYIGLPVNGAYVEWTVAEASNGVTLRFNMPDNATGTGETGALDVYVNGAYQQTVNLTSYWAYQYFPHTEPENVPSNRPRMRFDEVHFLLSNSLSAGDVLRFQKTNGDAFEYGIDFVETEQVAAPIAKPAGYVSVTDYGAIANDGISDLGPFYAAISAANAAGTGVYIPQGEWTLSNRLEIGTDGTTIQGAGMWYTDIYFETKGFFKGGILTYASDVEISHLYMNTANDSRFLPDGSPSEYKGINGHYGSNSKIHDIWLTHFSAGAWIGDYTPPITITQNLQFYNNRVRNCYADGINYTQGTSNSQVYQCNFRSNGDDAMAIWPTNGTGVTEAVNNLFYENTVEHTYRAGGAAIFGGDGHEIHHCIIKDNHTGSGIRLTTDFGGYKFTHTTSIQIYENTLIACGTSVDLFGFHRGALEINSSNGGVRGVTFSNIDIYDAQRHGVQIAGAGTDVTFHDIFIRGTGKDIIDGSQYSVPMGGAAVSVVGSSGTATFNGLTLANIERAPAIFNENSGFTLTINDQKDGNKRPILNTYWVDFGPNDGTNGNETSSPDANGNYWNNVTDHTLPSPAVSLVNAANQNYGVSLQLLTNFSRNGILNGGLLAPSTDFLGDFAIPTATQDYFFTTGTASFEVTGLDTGQHYVFHYFGTRNTSSTRITRYMLQGATTTSADQQTSGTNWGGTGYDGNQSVVSVSDTLKADVNGNITLDLSVVTGSFAYLCALKIEEIGPRNLLPTADAGSDLTLGSIMTSVSLSGSGTDPEGDSLAYQWTQVAGPAVSFDDATLSNPTISGLSSGTSYTFNFEVNDGIDVASDDVTVTVASPPPPVVAHTYYVDFGPDDVTNGNTTPGPDANGNHWNNVVNTTASTRTTLVDNQNASQGASLTLLNNFSKNGRLNGGLLAPDVALLGELAVGTATEDYFFTTSTASFELSGLSTANLYVIEFFGTRNTSQIRVTDFTVTGTGPAFSGSLQTSGADLGGTGYNGNNRTVLKTDTLYADANGKLTVDVSVNQGSFAYIGWMKVTELTIPAERTVSGAHVAWRYAYGNQHKFVSLSGAPVKQSIDKISVSGTIGGILTMGTEPAYLQISANNGSPSVKQLEHAVISQNPSSNFDAQWISGDEELVYNIGADLAGNRFRAVQWQLKSKNAGQSALITSWYQGVQVGEQVVALSKTAEYYVLDDLGLFDEIRIKPTAGSHVKIAGGSDNHLPEGPGYTMNRFYLHDYEVSGKQVVDEKEEMSQFIVSQGIPMQVYPNPVTTGELTIQLDTLVTTSAHMEIFSLQGQRVFSQKLKADISYWQLPTLSAGIYVLRVVDGENVWEEKLMIDI